VKMNIRPEPKPAALGHPAQNPPESEAKPMKSPVRVSYRKSGSLVRRGARAPRQRHPPSHRGRCPGIPAMNPKLPPEPMPKPTKPVPFAAIESRIHLVREARVMLDADLAALYGVTTKAVNQAVERNRQRFPLHVPSLARGVRQLEVTNCDLKRGRRYRPYAFTQEGLASRRALWLIGAFGGAAAFPRKPKFRHED